MKKQRQQLRISVKVVGDWAARDGAANGRTANTLQHTPTYSDDPGQVLVAIDGRTRARAYTQTPTQTFFALCRVVVGSPVFYSLKHTPDPPQ